MRELCFLLEDALTSLPRCLTSPRKSEEFLRIGCDNGHHHQRRHLRPSAAASSIPLRSFLHVTQHVARCHVYLRCHGYEYCESYIIQRIS